MNIIDTNAINFILEKQIKIKQKYFITPDIKDESEITEIVTGEPLPANILEISNDPSFNGALYLKNYQNALNSHSGKSFYNMSGFGDISILALVMTYFEKSNTLPGLEEPILIFTQDNGLIKRVRKEFPSKVTSGKITILNHQDIK